MAPPTNAPTTESLARSLQNLPQELFDTIYSFVVTASPAEAKITADYRPPLQLCLDRKTREDFAAEYYSSATFVLEFKDLARRWAQSLPKQHFNLVRRIRISATENVGYTSSLDVAMWAADRQNVGIWFHHHTGKVTEVMYIHWNGKCKVVEKWWAEGEGDHVVFRRVKEQWL